MLMYPFQPISKEEVETWSPSSPGRVYTGGELRFFLPIDKGGHAASTALENLVQHNGVVFVAIDVQAGQQYFKSV